MKKDRSKILGMGCILFAVFILIVSGIQYFHKEKKSGVKPDDSDFYGQTEEYDFNDMDNSTYVPEVTETVQATEEEFDDNVEPLVYEDFRFKKER